MRLVLSIHGSFIGFLRGCLRERARGNPRVFLGNIRETLLENHIWQFLQGIFRYPKLQIINYGSLPFATQDVIPLLAWRIIPTSKWLVCNHPSISHEVRPFGRGGTPTRSLRGRKLIMVINHLHPLG